MDLFHFTSNDELIIDKRKYIQSEPRIYGKPIGLWITDDSDDSWESWCLQEEFGLDQLKHKFKITIKDDANILKIGSLSEMVRFNETKYILQGYSIFNFCKMVDWEALSKDYDGVMIMPYRHEVRMEYEWYNPWDCSSGCIFDTNVIESVEKIY